MLHDLRRAYAFFDQLTANDLAISDDSMSQTKGAAFCALLHGSAKPFSLALRSNTRRYARQGRVDHSKDIGVEAVRVYDVYLVRFYETTKAAKLRDKVAIIKAGEGVFVNLSNAELLRLSTQRAALLQTGQTNPTVTAEV